MTSPVGLGGMGEVLAAAFSPDGTRVAIGHNALISLFDLSSGERVRLMVGHTNAVTSVVYSPDGTKLLTGSMDGTVRLWNVMTGFPLHVYQDYWDQVNAVAFSPDGALVAAAQRSEGGNGGRIVAWTLEGTHVHTVSTTSSIQLTVSFTPDATQVLTGGSDGMARLWNLETGTVAKAYGAHTDWVGAAALSPDGTRVLTVSEDGTAKVSDTATTAVLRTYIHPVGDWALSGAFSPDGKLVLTGASDGKVRLWNLNTDIPVREYEGLPGNVSAVAFSPNGEWVLGAAELGAVRVWNRATGEEALELTQESWRIDFMALASDENTLAVGSRTIDKVTILDLDSGERGRDFEGHGGGITALAISSDGARIAAAGLDNQIRILNTVSGDAVTSLTGHTRTITAVAFAPNRQQVATTSVDNTARVWDAGSGQLLHEFSVAVPQTTLRSVAFSPDGTRIVVGTGRGTAQVWVVATEEAAFAVAPFSDYVDVGIVAYSPDGQWILTSGSVPQLRLWHSADGSAGPQYNVPLRVVSAVFSTDSNRILAGLVDGRTYAVDIETGDVMRVFRGQLDAVLGLGLQTRERRILALSADRTLFFWPGHLSTEILRAVLGVFFPVPLYDVSKDDILAIEDAIEALQTLPSLPGPTPAP